MPKLALHFVDVFAEEKYAGNQLAVVREARGLSTAEMQAIAREMHFSETSFILSEKKREGGYDVRIFTPEEELPFAGHPTLGTAYVISQEIVKKKTDKVILNLKVGQIPVTITYTDSKPDVLWMRQKQPTFGTFYDVKTIADALNLEVADIDPAFPIQEVSTGISAIIVPLRTLSAVKRARTDRNKYFELVKNTEAKSILVFCPETYHGQNHLNVRVFVDFYGIPEDPATGSANGCLAAYLVKHGYFAQNKINIRVEQGYEIKRPSLLLLKAALGKGGRINVDVGGEVVPVAKGELL
jgi:trans-2,3-dihydro-3-hydroxyanthranilate isomerase